jgi:L-iditol 2-dehydrogenase
MKSIVLSPLPGGHGFAPKTVDLEEPRAGEGELVVDMQACGLCGTDVEKIRGEYTASMPVIGHEAVGAVREAGAGVQGLRAGDRVFPHHHVPDYSCYLCKSGNETMCKEYRTSNISPGGFSERILVPRWNVESGGVLKVPDAMGWDVAALIEPLACCVRAVRKVHVEPGESVLVAGAGPVGMMHTLLLSPVGSKVVVSDVSEKRLRLAERSGASVVVDASKSDVPEVAARETGGRGVDVAIVASGSKAAILQALRSVRKGGRVCLFGVPPKGSVLDYDISALYNAEQELTTSYGASEVDTKAALNVLASRGGEFGALVTHRFRLSEFDRALETASSGAGMKVVVTP